MKFNVFCLSAVLSLTSLLTASAADPVFVEIETTKGNIVLELNAERAPISVENFMKYVEKKHYEGTIFHRVKPEFMIQGGGMDEKLSERPTMAEIRNEAGNGLKNDEYTVAMARRGDPHSASCQFYINSSENNSFLNQDLARGNYGYAVFGKVIAGKDVVDTIELVKTKAVPHPKDPTQLMRDVPAEPVTINSIKKMGAAKARAAEAKQVAADKAAAEKAAAAAAAKAAAASQ